MSNVLRKQPDFEVGDKVVWDTETGPQDVADPLHEEHVRQYGEGPFTVVHIEQVEGVCNYVCEDGSEPIFCELSTCDHEKDPNFLVYVEEIDKPFGFLWFTKA